MLSLENLKSNAEELLYADSVHLKQGFRAWGLRFKVWGLRFFGV